MTDDNDLLREAAVASNDGYLRGPALGAADRIDALTEQLEAARLDAKEAEAYSVWLEGKLAKAVEALREIADAFGCECGDAASATLAEIEGDKR
jgi:hypothetical protein